MNPDKHIIERLRREARNAASNSYSPYSNFPVGAAVLTDNGSIYKGTNIEIVSFAGTTCAERVAVVNAIADGAKKITAVAIYAPAKKVIHPCGICRQVLCEFAEKDCLIHCFNDYNQKEYILSDLLPEAFNTLN